MGDGLRLETQHDPSERHIAHQQDLRLFGGI